MQNSFVLFFIPHARRSLQALGLVLGLPMPRWAHREAYERRQGRKKSYNSVQSDLVRLDAGRKQSTRASSCVLSPEAQRPVD